MRVLIAQPRAMLGEGIARIVRDVAPRADVVTRGKADLLADICADAEVPAAVIVAYPWLSLASLRTLRKAWPASALVVITSRADAATQRRLLADHPEATRHVGDLNLTPRQFDVLMLIAAGRANRDIAVELGIGVRTVKGHVAVILRAMHVDDRRAARLRARRWLARRDRNVDRHAGVPASG